MKLSSSEIDAVVQEIYSQVLKKFEAKSKLAVKSPYVRKAAKEIGKLNKMIAALEAKRRNLTTAVQKENPGILFMTQYNEAGPNRGGILIPEVRDEYAMRAILHNNVEAIRREIILSTISNETGSITRLINQIVTKYSS